MLNSNLIPFRSCLARASWGYIYRDLPFGFQSKVKPEAVWERGRVNSLVQTECLEGEGGSKPIFTYFYMKLFSLKLIQHYNKLDLTREHINSLTKKE